MCADLVNHKCNWMFLFCKCTCRTVTFNQLTGVANSIVVHFTFSDNNHRKNWRLFGCPTHPYLHGKRHWSRALILLHGTRFIDNAHPMCCCHLSLFYRCIRERENRGISAVINAYNAAFNMHSTCLQFSFALNWCTQMKTHSFTRILAAVFFFILIVLKFKTLELIKNDSHFPGKIKNSRSNKP